MQQPEGAGFYDARTGSIQYVVACPSSRRCAIIDPVLDFDEKSGSTATTNADVILDYVNSHNLKLEWILDTHPHADHFSAAGYLKAKTGVPIAIGERVKKVQQIWQEIYNWPDLACDGSQWDRLFGDGEIFKIGELEARVMHSPGHTLASITYVIGDAAFIHDTLFMPDSGSARADFPGGSAADLWQSIQDILSLPGETRLFTGHDYRPGGRQALWESSVAEQKEKNKHVVGQSRSAFIRLREARDRALPMPRLMLHALQVNIRGGELPQVEENGLRYLKIPLNALPGSVWGQ
ncbi:MBL fold metallo-hydrolase [Mesorhizobium sp. M0701]|uniref:MBL fold metallo-hydrolase n=1 Tax=Mesorhizobium sp. M0701 TaxID=2956989 RepID=UPI00333BA8B1